jgi:DNA-binding response OmpR family regulator
MGTINGNGTVMLVDDEDVVLNIGTLMLKKLGYNVLEARNGKEAKTVYGENKETICLVILDMNLPDEQGSDTCKKLKEINPDVKVLHSSGLGGSQGNEVLECGCTQSLPKPFRLAELSAKVKELLEDKEHDNCKHYG